MYNCRSDSTYSYNCLDQMPEYIPQPIQPPSYSIHIPTMRDKFDDSCECETLSWKVSENPCAVAAANPFLLRPSSRSSSNSNHDEERFVMKGVLSPRCGNTDVYRPGEPMHDTYTGHVPGFFGSSHGPNRGREVINTKIFLNNAGYYNSKFKFRDFLEWNHPQTSQFET